MIVTFGSVLFSSIGNVRRVIKFVVFSAQMEILVVVLEALNKEAKPVWLILFWNSKFSC